MINVECRDHTIADSRLPIAVSRLPIAVSRLPIAVSRFTIADKMQPTIFFLIQPQPAVPAQNHWLSPRERAVLEKLRFRKRIADWRLGRWTAKLTCARALRLDDTPSHLHEIEILAATDGAPEAFFRGDPAPLALSLSHSHGLALCAVHAAGSAIGCDLERIEARSDAFTRDYFTGEERARIAAAEAHHRALLVTLLWSAKESALKALRLGLRLDTRRVQVQPPISLVSGGAWQPLTVSLAGTTTQFRGWWRVQGAFVHTLLAGEAAAPPLDLTNLPWMLHEASL